MRHFVQIFRLLCAWNLSWRNPAVSQSFWICGKKLFSTNISCGAALVKWQNNRPLERNFLQSIKIRNHSILRKEIGGSLNIYRLQTLNRDTSIEQSRRCWFCKTHLCNSHASGSFTVWHVRQVTCHETCTVLSNSQSYIFHVQMNDNVHTLKIIEEKFIVLWSHASPHNLPSTIDSNQRLHYKWRMLLFANSNIKEYGSISWDFWM